MGEPTHQKAAAARAAARQDRSELRAALVTERAGYVQRGLDERVEYADAQIAALDQLDEDDPDDFDDKGTGTAEADELRATVDELIDLNAKLVTQNSELTVENERLRGLVPDAPPADSATPAPATPDPAPTAPESEKTEAPKGRQRRSAAAAAEPKAD